MKRIGITGGIGSGKSVVTQLLSLYGIPVYIADDESKKLTRESPVIREALIALFGYSIYTDQGLNKPMLASLIFKDDLLLKKVNSIIHPVVADDFKQWCDSRQNNTFCAIESAILYESGFDKLTDVSLMVYAPLEIRIERVLSRDRASKDAVENRIKSQMPDEEKSKLADFTIFNDGVQPLIPQVEKFLAQIAQNIG